VKIFSNNGDCVNIKIWAHGGGEFKPLQTEDPIDEFNISINDEKFIVYYNKSKSNIDYYYLNFKGLWHWTRDNIRNHNQYTT
jgi:hypothetical protein